MLTTIALISLRNLVRQRRRSILLGIAVAFGAMILVTAHSFSRGISDVLFNRIIVYVSGHISINFAERGNYFRQIFYDRERIAEIVQNTIPSVTSREESIGALGRGIGKGKADNLVIVGIDLRAEMSREEVERAEQNFAMVEGSFEDLADSSVGTPVLIARKKAEYLNLGMGDILKVRFTNVMGRQQAARLTVVGIFEPANAFMAFPVFVELRYLKPLMGYGEHHTPPIYVTIEHPRRDAARLADSLHARLQPKTAVLPARLDAVPGGPVLPVFGFNDDSTSMHVLDSMLAISGGSLDGESMLVNTVAARRYGIATGDTVRYSFVCKHDSARHGGEFVVSGTVSIPACTAAVALLNPTDFYARYYPRWPDGEEAWRDVCGFASREHPLVAAGVVAPQWELMERSRSTKEAQQRFRDMAAMDSKAVVIDVRSMYETAGAVLQLEQALNLITLTAVLVLFFIILTGVVNTLRMAVRERTREIGTIRSIGMQRSDVRSLFLLEAVFLAFFASVAGTVGALGLMEVLKLFTFDAGENPLGMVLVNGRLHFAPSPVSILVFIALICLITALTAWGPARRAATMQPSNALRTFE